MIAHGIVHYTVLCSGFVCDLNKALLPLAYVEMLLNFWHVLLKRLLKVFAAGQFLYESATSNQVSM